MYINKQACKERVTEIENQKEKALEKTTNVGRTK